MRSWSLQARGIGYVANVQRDAADRFHVAQVGDDHLVRSLLAFACGIENDRRLFGMRRAHHLLEDLAHVRASRTEHVIEALAVELAGVAPSSCSDEGLA